MHLHSALPEVHQNSNLVDLAGPGGGAGGCALHAAIAESALYLVIVDVRVIFHSPADAFVLLCKITLCTKDCWQNKAGI